MSQFHWHEGLSRFHWHEGSRPDSEDTNLGFERNQEEKIQLLEEAIELEEREAEEIKQKNRKLKRSCWALMLCPVVLGAYRWTLYWWGVTCLVLALMATGAWAQEEGGISVREELPPQVLKGMDMLHQAYQLKAFDCNNPEEMVTQSIPKGCLLKGLDGTSPTVESKSAPK